MSTVINLLPTIVDAYGVNTTQAVELITLGWRSETDKLMDLLEKHNLALVCQIHTTGGYIAKGKGYIYCDSYVSLSLFVPLSHLLFITHPHACFMSHICVLHVTRINDLCLTQA